MESIQHNLEQLRMIKEQKLSLVEDQYTIKVMRESVQKDALDSQEELKKNVDLCFEIKDNIDKFDSIIEMKENLKLSLIEKKKKKEEQINEVNKEKDDVKMIEKDDVKNIEKEDEKNIEKEDVKNIEKEDEKILEKKEDDENMKEKILEKEEEGKDNKIDNEDEKEQNDDDKDLDIDILDDEINNLKIERNRILDKFNCYFEKNKNIREKISLLEGKIKKIMEYEVRLEERLRFIDYGIIELEDSIRRDQIQFYQSKKNTLKFENCKYKEIKEKYNYLIEENSCQICLMPFNDEDNVTIFSCNKHYYHEKCLKDWMEYQIVCPICREIYSDKEENK